MELSFAPMEGVTGCIYRRIHAECFPGADVYYAPFIAPDSSGRFKGSALRELLPENNPGITLVPQLLCNAPEPFLAAARELADLGYGEVNLNVGCPSGTVVKKHKGAGMLADPAFLAKRTQMYQVQDSLFRLTYRFFMDGQSDSVIALCDYMDAVYPASDLKYNFMYLRLMESVISP